MSFITRWFQKNEDRSTELNQLHRRAQRAESDAIHYMRLAQNLEMRLDYAVQKIKDLRLMLKVLQVAAPDIGVTRSEQESLSGQLRRTR